MIVSRIDITFNDGSVLGAERTPADRARNFFDHLRT